MRSRNPNVICVFAWPRRRPDALQQKSLSNAQHVMEAVRVPARSGFTTSSPRPATFLLTRPF
jgi:hypothetical protein